MEEITLTPKLYSKVLTEADKYWNIDWIKEAWGIEHYNDYFNMIITTVLEQEEQRLYPIKINKPKRKKKLDILERMKCSEFDKHRKQIKKKYAEDLKNGNLHWKVLIEEYERATGKDFIEKNTDNPREVKELSKGLYGAFIMIDWSNGRLVHVEKYR